MATLNTLQEPTTTEFGLVEATVESVAHWWLRRETAVQLSRGGTANLRPLAGSLTSMLRALLPLTSVERRRSLFVATNSPWTAVFDNGWQGGNAAGLSLAARELHCRAVRVVCVPDTKVGKDFRRYGARIFELYGPQETNFLNYERTISVANDGGSWRMDLSGSALPGEDARWFAARQVKDRFTPDALSSLLGTLGIDAFNLAYYLQQGLLVEREGGESAPGYREYDLSEVQATWK